MTSDTQLPTLLRKIPDARQHGPRIVGIAATNPKALVRFCPCTSADACQGDVVAGRNCNGNRCKRHLEDTLEVA